MATWKKILLEGDAVSDNIGSADLTVSGNRDLDLGANTFTISAGSPGAGENQQGISMAEDSAFTITSPSTNIKSDATTTPGQLRLEGVLGYYVGLQCAAADTSNTVYTLPNGSSNAPTTGDCLVSSSTGSLSWSSRLTRENPSALGALSVNNVQDGTTGQARLLIEDYSGGEFVGIDAPNSVSSTYTITLPSSAPGGTKILQSDSNGDLSWIDTPSGGGSIDGSGASGEVTYWDDADTLTSHSGFTYDGNGNVDISKNVTAAKGFLGQIASEVISTSSNGDTNTGCEVLQVASSFATTGGKMYYLNNTSTWTLADKDTVASAEGWLVMARSSNATGGMILRGLVHLSSASINGTPSVGDALYMYDDGGLTVNSSDLGTGDYQRRVGHYVATNTIYFNPSLEYIKLL